MRLTNLHAMLKKFWNDPVWSKVIASVIFAFGALLATYFLNWWPSQSSTVPSSQNIAGLAEPSYADKGKGNMPLAEEGALASHLKTAPITSESIPVDSNQNHSKKQSIREIKLSKEAPFTVDHKPTAALKIAHSTSENKLGDSTTHPPTEQPQKEPKPSKEVPSEVDDKPVVTLKAVVSDRNIREAVSAAASALRHETTSDRVRSVAALLNELPENLNAKEIVLLAGNETTSHRENILELLVKRTRPLSLDPEDIPSVLGHETTSNRVNCIHYLAQFIKPPITGRQAAAILGSETGSHRVASLRLITHLLQRPLSDTEVESILKGTSTSSRTEAIKALFGQGKSSEEPLGATFVR